MTTHQDYVARANRVCLVVCNAGGATTRGLQQLVKNVVKDSRFPRLPADVGLTLLKVYRPNPSNMG